MPRSRTTKKLAQRIDLSYFKRSHPMRRWRTLLSIGVPVAALLWLGAHAFLSDERTFSAGTLSEPHAVLTGKCLACHSTGLFWSRGKVSDQKCQACHDGSIHHATQTFTPACSSCHVEHQGAAVRIAVVSDAACTQCHANLQARGTPARFVPTIHSFNGDHPEFAVLREERANPATIQLNHYLHMQPNLTGPGGRVQMTCNDCHRSAVGETRSWRFADPQLQAAAVSGPAAKADPFAVAPPRAYMLPSTYARTCAACHTLQFDSRLPDAVPHDTPEAIHPFIVAKLQAYIAAHPAELRVPREPERTLPEKPVAEEFRVLTPPQWVAERTAEDEQLLWRKTCKQCHAITPGTASPQEASAVLGAEEALPKIAASNLGVRYLPHAKFDHSQHGLIQCTSCHTGVTASQKTADLLLPGIATCQSCHHPGTEAAESRCFECHTYHDPLQHQPAHSTFSLPDLVSQVDPPRVQ